MVLYGKSRIERDFVVCIFVGVMLMLLAVNVPSVAASTGSFAEDFTSTTYLDNTVTNAAGWGQGSLQIMNKAPQLLATFDTPGWASDVAISNGIAYVADAWGQGLSIINVTDPWHPVLLGNHTTVDTRAVVVDGLTAFIADNVTGLIIMNVTDPRHPEVLGTMSGSSYDVAVRGGIAYAANGNAGLKVVNVTDRRHPTLLGTYDSPGFARGVWVDGHFAYVADTGGLRIVNVTNPRNPTWLSSCSTTAASSVAVAGQFAYVADGVSGLGIINITDCRNPTPVGIYNTPGRSFDVSVQGQLAYVADGSSGLQFINITNPRKPVLVGSFDTPDTALSVLVDGRTAYIADQSSGLVILRVASMTPPTAVGNFGGVQSLGDIAVEGNIAYLADDGFGIHVFNITDPRNPTLLVTAPYYTFHLVAAGGIVYMTRGMGFDIINFTDPKNPTLLGSYARGNAGRFAVVGSIAYIGGDFLTLVNVSNPRQPTLLSSYGEEGSLLASDLAVSGGIAYYTDGLHKVLRILNVTNPYEPESLCNYTTAYTPYLIAVDGGTAYLGTTGDLEIFNVTNPRQPVLLGTYHGVVQGLNYQGGIVYISGMAGVFTLLDVTNPRNPVVLDNSTRTGVSETAIVGNYAFLYNCTIEVQRNLFQLFYPTAQAQSLTVFNSTGGRLEGATLTPTQTLPNGTAISYELSPNGGTSWELVSPNDEHNFTAQGTLLRWRATLTTNDSRQTPVLTHLVISYVAQEATTTPADWTSTAVVIAGAGIALAVVVLLVLRMRKKS